MRFLSSFIAAAVAAPGVLSTPFPVTGDIIAAVAGSENKVPGKNPFYYCNVHERSQNQLEIDHVDLNPERPKAGTVLTISAAGEVLKPIEEGAYADVEIKLGMIKILTTQFDLCEQVENVELRCPIDQGKLTIVKDVELPKEIPPAQYTVTAMVRTAKDEPITCLTGSIDFRMGSRMDL